MHTLVDMLDISRKEFNRNLKGLSDGDARKRIEPMNCISWIIAHVANQHHAFFVARPLEKQIDPRYLPYGYGSPPSQPSLEEALTLWKDACDDSEAWLKSVTTEELAKLPATSSTINENMGALMTRCIFHTWFHLGEINSIRQILGHKAPDFVYMYDWQFKTGET